jgi:hypothetical protein
MLVDPFRLKIIIAACAVAYVVGRLYVLVPLRIRKTHWFAANPEMRPIDPAVRIPPQVKEFLKRADEPLCAVGYEPLGDHANTNFAQRVAGTTRLFVNRGKRTMASVIVTYVKNREGIWKINQPVIGFRTDFDDGFVLFTSNAGPLNARPHEPTIRSYRFVEIQDPEALNRIHEAIVERFFNLKTRDLVLDSKFNGDATRFKQWQAMQEPTRLVETGYYYHDEVADTLRLTLKGAFLTVWKGRWPWKQLRIRKRDRDAAQILRAVGMNESGKAIEE